MMEQSECEKEKAEAIKSAVLKTLRKEFKAMFVSLAYNELNTLTLAAFGIDLPKLTLEAMEKELTFLKGVSDGTKS